MEFFLAISLALGVGFASAAQGATNASLGKLVGAVQASMVSFGGGLIVLSIMCAFFGTGDLTAALGVPWWELLGGVYGAFIVFMMAYCTPELGSALTMTLLMFGQLAGGITIDTLGLLKATAIPLSPLRLVGCLVVLAGIIVVYVGRRRQDAHLRQSSSWMGGQPINRSSVIYVILALVAGLASAIQTPTIAALGAATGTIEASVCNFIVGFVLLLALAFILNHGRLLSLRGATPWKMTGGLYGAYGIPAVVTATPIIGVSLVLGMEMFGQLVGGFVLDATGWFQVKKEPVDRMRVIGALVVAIGVALVTLSQM